MNIARKWNLSKLSEKEQAENIAFETGGFIMECEQCKKSMNPIETMLGPMCGNCVRKRHKETIEGEENHGSGV